MIIEFDNVLKLLECMNYDVSIGLKLLVDVTSRQVEVEGEQSFTQLNFILYNYPTTQLIIFQTNIRQVI